MLRKFALGASVMAIAASVGAMAHAQGSAADAFNDTIVVTATKKANAEDVQDVPLAVTAFGAKQLDAIKVRDLQSLTYAVPNVSFDDIGTTKGVANFSIRGLGVNSSIPSIDPTVGVFVDGMYLGINAGVVFDIFDLESIEVLRGPQGILFGRNTTGGAVLINTKRPSDEWEARLKLAAESGFIGTGGNYYAMASVGGPIIEDNLRGKIVVYYNNDDGWFSNYQGGPNLEAQLQAIGGTPAALQGLGFPIAQNMPDAFENFGKAETIIVRPSLYWTPTERFEATLRFEHGETEGDGPPIQNHPGANGIPNIFYSADRNSFDFSVNDIGFYDNSWDQLIGEARLDLGGWGVFTNIVGWRQYSSLARSDIDGTPFFLFHGNLDVEQDQISEELRYNNRLLDSVDLTLGLYYFSQDIAYNEDRDILGGALFFNGGGVQDQRTLGFFGQADISLTDYISLNFGGRYTYEKKEVVISNLLLNTTPCDITIRGACTDDFIDSNSWKNFTPKVGLTWAARDDLNLYAHWTKGVRSGGYNFRNSSLAFPPGPFDEETVNSYELGFKAQPAGGKATINAAFFLTDIDDMQREINLADPIAGVVQLIRNTADATIWGFELESRISITDNLVFIGSLGHTKGDYDVIRFDLTGDGVIDDADLGLEIPRLAPWTWGVGFVHSTALTASINLDTRFNYSHRDMSFYTDNNLGFLNEFDSIDAGVALNFGGAAISFYGKNLLDDVNHGGDTQLPSTLGFGAGGAVTKGRVIGVELQLDL